MISETLQLPELRGELSIYPAPPSNNGSPVWSIHDPTRNLFFQIDWVTFEILCRWELSDRDKITNSINKETTLYINSDSINSVIDFLTKHQLIKRSTAQDTKQMSELKDLQKQQWHMGLLKKYLFFRISLWNPDKWLESTLAKVQWLGSPLFFWLTLCALTIGLLQTSRQWDSFTATFIDLFSLKGLIAYGITLIGIKFLHELGHAFTAKYYGCKVPSMGVAFLVMFPMAFTDVNDVWRLCDKKKRLRVGGAGILTELSIAAWATFFWAFLPDGLIKDSVFLLATTTWVSTIIINTSPFLRFDGYFLLMDSLEIPNLHQRSFELARWQLRQWLFKINDSIPEFFSKRRHRFLVAFAFFNWFYRLIIFGGIAILVYFLFPKPLGPFLAAVEIYWFILKPILLELKVWGRKWRDIILTARSKITLITLLGIIFLVTFSWDMRIESSALLRYSDIQIISTPIAVQIKDIHISSGEPVKKGRLLIELHSHELDYQLNRSLKRESSIKRQLSNSTLNDNKKSDLPIIKANLNRTQSEIRGFKKQLNSMNQRASTSGILYWTDIDIKAGDWIQSKSSFGKIVETNNFKIHAYVQQEDLSRISIGDNAIFFSDSNLIEPISLRVESIDTDSTRVLTEPILASIHGGNILVREQGKQLIPENAIYHITLKPAEHPKITADLPILTGKTVISGQAESWLKDFWRSAVAIIRREAGF